MATSATETVGKAQPPNRDGEGNPVEFSPSAAFGQGQSGRRDGSKTSMAYHCFSGTLTGMDELPLPLDPNQPPPRGWSFGLWRILAVVTACGVFFGVIRFLGEELICPGILFAIVIGGAGIFLTPWEWGRLIALLVGIAGGVATPLAIGITVGEPYGWLFGAFGAMLGLPLGPFVTDRLWHRLTRTTAGKHVSGSSRRGVE